MAIDRFLRIFMLAAGLPVLAGAGLAAHTCWWTTQAYRLEAVVSRFEAAPRSTTRDSVTTYWMHVSFADPVDGSMREARTGAATNLWKQQKGDPVEVYWSPARPERVSLASLFWLYFAPVVTALPGVLMLAVLLVLRKTLRRRLPGL